MNLIPSQRKYKIHSKDDSLETLFLKTFRSHTQYLVNSYSQLIQNEGDRMDPTDKEIIVDIVKKAQMKISFLQSLQDSNTQSPQTTPDESPLDQFRL